LNWLGGNQFAVKSHFLLTIHKNPFARAGRKSFCWIRGDGQGPCKMRLVSGDLEGLCSGQEAIGLLELRFELARLKSLEGVSKNCLNTGKFDLDCDLLLMK